MLATEFTDLPSEIIDVIFDELWDSTLSEWSTKESDRRALILNYLPVSMDFRHRVLSRSCRYVSLFDICRGDKRITRLSEVISQPLGSRLDGIGRYIQHFSLQLSNGEHGSVSDPEALYVWDLDSDQGLAAVIEGLHGEQFGVKEFSLFIYARDSDLSGSVAWTDIPVGFQSVFRSLLQSPYLTHLNLVNFACLPEVFFSGAHLKYLSIKQSPSIFMSNWAACTAELDPIPVSSALPFPSLEVLLTDYSDESDTIFPPTSMLGKLKSYTEFANERLHSKETWLVLMLSASSLEEIHIAHTGNVVKPPKAFNLGLIPNLKVFEYSRRFTALYPFISLTDETPLNLLTLFDVTKRMEHLESITIKFNLHEIRHPDKHFMHETITDPAWAAMDLVLSGFRFPYLRRFEISIKVTTALPNWSDTDRNVFINSTGEYLKSSFRRILATESISVELGVEAYSPFYNEPAEEEEEDDDELEEGYIYDEETDSIVDTRPGSDYFFQHYDWEQDLP